MELEFIDLFFSLVVMWCMIKTCSFVVQWYPKKYVERIKHVILLINKGE